MATQKFQVKVYLDNPEALDLDKLIPVFHRFIREDTLGEFVMDVVDYGHVKDGPGVVLIGHGSDYYLEQREGRPGLLYSRKRDGSEDPAAGLEDAVKRALRAAAAIEQDATLNLRFGLGEVLVRVNDRTPVDAEAAAKTLSEVTSTVVGKAVGAPVSVAREGAARELLTVRAKGGSGTVSEALARLH